jgi:energy-coupling factor transporter ATP-binding protein EcfA2
MAATLPPPSVPPARAPIDVRLLQWFAIELILDSRARLVEGGAGGDTRIDLAQVFVDLPVDAWCGRDTSPDERQLVRSICQASPSDDEHPPREVGMGGNDRRQSRALIIGGPGSGKSTATTMISQLLRLEQVRARLADVPALLQERVRVVAQGLDEMCERIDVEACRNLLPLRVNLPELSRWMASRDNEDPGQLLWRFLASRATDHAAICDLALELPPTELEALAQSHDSILWIFDGFDEVPRSAGRDRVIAVIHAAAPHAAAQGVLVTTRRQGYEGEFGDLDSLVLTEMPPDLALDYGQRLLRAWRGVGDPQLNERLASLEEEFAKTEVQALVRSPLHATMATLLVAEQGTLPNARHLLFEYYFETIFKRELGKKGDHGVRLEDRQLLKALHARVGLVLQTRSQDRAGTRPTLSPRELRAILKAMFGEEGRSTEDAQTITERMLRFAAERLVLLLRATDGGYEFGIRSLQEFFAGVALLDGETADVKHRLEAIALNPHWSNVLGLIVSGLAVPGAGSTRKAAALEYTRGLCRALNDGTLGGRPAAACVAGSRLAIAMLRETERYGTPWLHDPLWAIALEAARSPVQVGSARDAGRSSPRSESVSAQWDDNLEVHVRLGALAVNWHSANSDKWLQYVLESAKALLQGNKEHSSAG